jgi:hypothetical protein
MRDAAVLAKIEPLPLVPAEISSFPAATLTYRQHSLFSLLMVVRFDTMSEERQEWFEGPVPQFSRLLRSEFATTLTDGSEYEDLGAAILRTTGPRQGRPNGLSGVSKTLASKVIPRQTNDQVTVSQAA